MAEEVKGFGERLAKVETGFEELGNNLNRLAANVETLTRAVNNMSKPNWQVWLGFAAILITLVASENIYFRQALSNEAHTRNAMWAAQFRVNATLWNSSPLGAISKFPAGPFYFPEPP